MTIEINGMAHVILTVSRFDAARDFYQAAARIRHEGRPRR